MSLERYEHLDLDKIEDDHPDFQGSTFLGLVYGLMKDSRGNLKITITVPHRYLGTAKNLWDLDSSTVCQISVEKWSQAEEAKRKLGLV